MSEILAYRNTQPDISPIQCADDYPQTVDLKPVDGGAFDKVLKEGKNKQILQTYFYQRKTTQESYQKYMQARKSGDEQAIKLTKERWQDEKNELKSLSANRIQVAQNSMTLEDFVSRFEINKSIADRILKVIADNSGHEKRLQKYAFYKNEVQKRHVALNRQQETIDDLRDKVCDLNEEREKLARELEMLPKNGFKKLVNNKRIFGGLFKKDIEREEEQRSELRSQLKALDKKIVFKEAELKKREAKYNSLFDNVQGAEKLLAKFASRINPQKKEVSSKQVKPTEFLADKFKKSNKQIRDIQKSMGKGGLSIEEAEEQLKKLQSELQALSKEYSNGIKMSRLALERAKQLKALSNQGCKIVKLKNGKSIMVEQLAKQLEAMVQNGQVDCCADIHTALRSVEQFLEKIAEAKKVESVQKGVRGKLAQGFKDLFITTSGRQKLALGTTAFCALFASGLAFDVDDSHAADDGATLDIANNVLQNASTATENSASFEHKIVKGDSVSKILTKSFGLKKYSASALEHVQVDGLGVDNRILSKDDIKKLKKSKGKIEGKIHARFLKIGSSVQLEEGWTIKDGKLVQDLEEEANKVVSDDATDTTGTAVDTNIVDTEFEGQKGNLQDKIGKVQKVLNKPAVAAGISQYPQLKTEYESIQSALDGLNKAGVNQNNVDSLVKRAEALHTKALDLEVKLGKEQFKITQERSSLVGSANKVLKKLDKIPQEDLELEGIAQRVNELKDEIANLQAMPIVIANNPRAALAKLEKRVKKLKTNHRSLLNDIGDKKVLKNANARLNYNIVQPDDPQVESASSPSATPVVAPVLTASNNNYYASVAPEFGMEDDEFVAGARATVATAGENFAVSTTAFGNSAKIYGINATLSYLSDKTAGFFRGAGFKLSGGYLSKQNAWMSNVAEKQMGQFSAGAELSSGEIGNDDIGVRFVAGSEYYDTEGAKLNDVYHIGGGTSFLHKIGARIDVLKGKISAGIDFLHGQTEYDAVADLAAIEEDVQGVRAKLGLNDPFDIPGLSASASVESLASHNGQGNRTTTGLRISQRLNKNWQVGAEYQRVDDDLLPDSENRIFAFVKMLFGEGAKRAKDTKPSRVHRDKWQEINTPVGDVGGRNLRVQRAAVRTLVVAPVAPPPIDNTPPNVNRNPGQVPSKQLTTYQLVYTADEPVTVSASSINGGSIDTITYSADKKTVTIQMTTAAVAGFAAPMNYSVTFQDNANHPTTVSETFLIFK